MKITAAHFQDDLLAVLGELSNYTPGQVVLASDTYQPIMDRKGITSADEHGSKDGQPLVIKWIQWANNNLRNNGLSENKGRGKWSLTAAGVEEARKFLVLAEPNAAALVLESPVFQSRYHPDPYVVEVARGQVPCWGAYTAHKAAVCSSCGLAQECQTEQIRVMAEIAVTMRANRTIVKPPPATPGPVPAPPKVKTHQVDFTQGEHMLASVQTICACCQDPILEGEECLWVSEVPGFPAGALYHLACTPNELE